MRMMPRLFLLSLLPASLLLGMGTGASAEEARTPTWPCRRRPRLFGGPLVALVRSGVLARRQGAARRRCGDDRAGQGHRPRRHSAGAAQPDDRRQAQLSNDRDLELKTDWIYLPGGELDIGSEAHPYTHKATITLTDKVPDENINTMGDRGIMMLNGTLSLHGDRTNSWTKLGEHGQGRQLEDRGAERQRLAQGRRDRAGLDRLRSRTRRRSAPSPPSAATRSRSISRCKYMHFGKITYGVDERGEVGMLTRNIQIQASDDAEKSYFGGHIMAMAGSEDARLRRRAQPHGPEHAPRPLSDALAHRRRRPRASTSRTPRSTTPTAAA